MTREEAIADIRDNIKPVVGGKSLDMAIKALEQEPCEDVVSRKDLLKIYEDRFLELQKLKRLKENKGAEDRQMGVNYCINILKEMPPVTPQQKTGHWIDIDEGFSPYKCSECEMIEFKKSEYCPDCGAKMQEVEENDD